MRNMNKLLILFALFSVLKQSAWFPMQLILCICLFFFVIISVFFKRNVENSSSELDPDLISGNRYAIGFFIMLCICFFIPVATFKADIYRAVFELLRWFLLVFPFFISKRESKRCMMKGIYYGCTAAAFIGIIAFFMPVYFFTGEAAKWAKEIDGVYRMQSIFAYANTTAVICGAGIFLGIYFWEESNRKKPIHFMWITINCIAMVLTFSRLGMVCFMIAALFIFCKKYKMFKYISAVFAAVFVVTTIILFVLGKENLLLGSTLACRFIYWYDAFFVILKNPLGIGASTWENLQYKIQSAIYHMQYVHNGFLQLALEGGVAALATFIAFIVYCLKPGRDKEKNKVTDHDSYILAIIILIILHSFVDIDLSYPTILVILGIMLSYIKSASVPVSGTSPDTVLMPGSDTGKSKEAKFRTSPERVPCSVIMVTSIAFILAAAVFPKAYKANKPESADAYEEIIAKYEKSPGDIELISKLYNDAYQKNDPEGMYVWSKELITAAPRCQWAYNDYVSSMNQFFEDKNDEKYIEEKNALYERVEIINNTMNPLCKYLSKHRTIVITGLD